MAILIGLGLALAIGASWGFLIYQQAVLKETYTKLLDMQLETQDKIDKEIKKLLEKRSRDGH